MSNETSIADLSSSRIRLRISGADRVTFLHGQCTNDIRSLGVGKSCYGAFLDAKGKMRGEGHIVCLADSFLLETNPSLQILLEKYIVTEDVTIENVSASWGEWLVIGKPATLPERGMSFTHPLGLGLICAERQTATLTDEEVEIIRVEEGVPSWGVDMDENTIPIEAGLEARAISYTKGCYIGQETIARIKTYGHVNRRLVQLSVINDQLPVKGDRILWGDKDIGQITSAVRSLRLGKTLALGYVRREFATEGVNLTVNQHSAEVLKLCGQ